MFVSISKLFIPLLNSQLCAANPSDYKCTHKMELFDTYFSLFWSSISCLGPEIVSHMEKFWVVLDIVLIVLIVENVINSISHLTNLLEK